MTDQEKIVLENKIATLVKKINDMKDALRENEERSKGIEQIIEQYEREITDALNDRFGEEFDNYDELDDTAAFGIPADE